MGESQLGTRKGQTFAILHGGELISSSGGRCKQEEQGGGVDAHALGRCIRWAVQGTWRDGIKASQWHAVGRGPLWDLVVNLLWRALLLDKVPRGLDAPKALWVCGGLAGTTCSRLHVTPDMALHTTRRICPWQRLRSHTNAMAPTLPWLRLALSVTSAAPRPHGPPSWPAFLPHVQDVPTMSVLRTLRMACTTFSCCFVQSSSSGGSSDGRSYSPACARASGAGEGGSSEAPKLQPRGTCSTHFPLPPSTCSCSHGSAREGLHKRLEVVERDPRIPRLLEVAADYQGHKAAAEAYHGRNDEKIACFEKQVRV